jgi:hypothetical protein
MYPLFPLTGEGPAAAKAGNMPAPRTAIITIARIRFIFPVTSAHLFFILFALSFCPVPILPSAQPDKNGRS